jgi:hypothetical protein
MTLKIFHFGPAGVFQVELGQLQSSTSPRGFAMRRREFIAGLGDAVSLRFAALSVAT